MSPYASGTNKSFSCAKSFQVAQIKVTEFRWHASPVYQKKSLIGRRKSSRIWRNQMALSKRPLPLHRGAAENLRKAPINRSWIFFSLHSRAFHSWQPNRSAVWGDTG